MIRGVMVTNGDARCGDARRLGKWTTNADEQNGARFPVGTHETAVRAHRMGGHPTVHGAHTIGGVAADRAALFRSRLDRATLATERCRREHESRRVFAEEQQGEGHESLSEDPHSG
jgi:hypothetical protein